MKTLVKIADAFYVDEIEWEAVENKKKVIGELLIYLGEDLKK